MWGCCACCGDEVENKFKRYMPNCKYIAADFFYHNDEKQATENSLATFFATLLLASQNLLSCTHEKAKEFMFLAFNDDVPLSAAFDNYFSKYNERAYPNINRANVMKLWMLFDKDHSGDLSYREYKKVCECLNFPDDLKEKILSYFTNKQTTVTYSQFENSLIRSSILKELEFLFTPDPKKETMSKESFKKFINDVQNEPVDDAETEKRMIELGCLSATELTKMEFLEYLSLSRYAALVKLDSASNVYHDMKRPICEYFINSSHNTYLTAGQLTGKSSTEMYKKALLDGCRCVELDCWNGPVREPIVYHGHTRTSKIRFVDCIKTIKEFAFVASPYPVILSLEVHTDLKQQDRMATILTKYLGDSLLKPTWQPNEAPDIDLSPESLKYKFLVKCKRGNFTIEAGMYKDEDDCDDADVDDEVYLTAKEERKSDKKESTSEFLSSLVTIESAGYKGTENLSYLSNRHPYHCTSLSEKKAKTVYEENPHAFTKINAACLTRIYPAGTRFDSSNYNPQGYWNCGCQIVALNWQSVKTFEWRHNKAFFMDNGNCGYLLKPPCLLPPFPTAERKSLTVEIISGFCLPKPKGNDKKSTLDPCVSLSVEGPGVDNTPHRTAIIKDNGFRPVWRGTGVNTFSWSIPNWDMSSIAIQVYDGNNLTTSGLVGERILPLRLISSGCRRMYLWNAKGVEVAGACVMCMISLT